MIILANLLNAIAMVLDMAISFFIFMVIARAIISWVNADPYNPIVRFLSSTTDPLLNFMKKKIPLVAGSVDFSPLALLVLLYFARAFLVATLYDYSEQLKLSLSAGLFASLV